VSECSAGAAEFGCDVGALEFGCIAGAAESLAATLALLNFAVTLALLRCCLPKIAVPLPCPRRCARPDWWLSWLKFSLLCFPAFRCLALIVYPLAASQALTKDVEGLEKRLGAKGFADKAPANVVAEAKATLADKKEQLATVTESLEAMKTAA